MEESNAIKKHLPLFLHSPILSYWSTILLLSPTTLKSIRFNCLSVMVEIDPHPGLLIWLGEVKHGVNLSAVSGLRTISMDEIKTHDKKTDCWTVIRGKVYDVTSFMEYHPGGLKMLMKGAGKDGTSLFNKYHSYVSVDTTIENLLIGYLESEPVELAVDASLLSPSEMSNAIMALQVSPSVATTSVTQALSDQDGQEK